MTNNTSTKTFKRTINLSLPADIYKEIERLSKQRKLSRSEILRWALKQYIASEKIWDQIYKWGKESAKSLGIKNEKDVGELIHQFRKEYKS